jgi:hypothetical protein
MTDTNVGGVSMANRRAGDDASPNEMAVAAAGAVKQEVASFADSTKDKVLDKVEEKKHVATETLGDFANAIRKAGEELSQSDQSMAARVVKQAAEGLEGLSRSVSDKRPEEMLEAVRDFGRSNPTAFIAGSVLVGLALGRFARSSENHGSAAKAPDATPEAGSKNLGARSAGAENGASEGRSASASDGALSQPADPVRSGNSLPYAGE